MNTRCPCCWQPIETAPHQAGGRKPVLVNDTNAEVCFGIPPWVAAFWIESEAWTGWRYADEDCNDSHPLGPEPTHWLDIPPVPKIKRFAADDVVSPDE